MTGTCGATVRPFLRPPALPVGPQLILIFRVRHPAAAPVGDAVELLCRELAGGFGPMSFGGCDLHQGMQARCLPLLRVGGDAAPARILRLSLPAAHRLQRRHSEGRGGGSLPGLTSS